MSLTNSQFNELKREYDKKHFALIEEVKAKEAKLYTAIPELSSLDEERSSVVKNAMLDPNLDYHSLLDDIAKRRKNAIKSAGYPEDYLTPNFKCKDCQDTGFINYRPCHCFKQAAIDLIYTQSGIKEKIAFINFDTFMLDIYSDKIIECGADKGFIPLQLASQAKQSAIEFTDKFSTGKYLNTDERLGMLIQGNTGCGKTFLSYCIAQRVMSYGCSVLYFTANELFEILSKSRFEHDDEAEFTDDNILHSDLLIIDDLGSEMINKFTSASIFDVINRRMTANLPTVISTNLSIGELRDSYSERFNSRVLSTYKYIKLAGADLRLSHVSAQAN